MISRDEVYEFYNGHDLSLNFIKQATLAGARLDRDDMIGKLATCQADVNRFRESLASFAKWRHSNMTLKEKIIDKLEDTVYYTGYYFSYPVLWVADWLWEGISKAYEDTW